MPGGLAGVGAVGGERRDRQGERESYGVEAYDQTAHETNLRRRDRPEPTIHDGGGGRHQATARRAPGRGGACPALSAGRRGLRRVRPPGGVGGGPRAGLRADPGRARRGPVDGARRARAARPGGARRTTTTTARTLADSAAAFLPGEPVAFMPSRGAAHGSGLEPAPHLVGERSRALHTLAAGGLVAVSADALVERLPPPASRPRPVELRLGEERPFDELTRALAEAGYERADTVEERGQFSVRGGLVDIFPSTGREPVRAEFFGDSLERLSAFSAFTQRSLRDLDHVVVHPAAETAETGSDPTGAWGVEEDEAAGARRARLAASRARRLRRDRRLEPRGAGCGGRRGLRRGGGSAARSRDARARVRPCAGGARADRRGLGARGDAARPARLVRRPAAGAGVVRRRRGRERAAQPHAGGLPRARRASRISARRAARISSCAGSRRRSPIRGRAAPTSPGWRSASRSSGGGSSRRACAWPCCPRPSSSAAAARAGRRGSAARSRRSPTCAPATTSSTRITASGGSSASTPRRSAASCATTSTSSSGGTTACTCPTTSSPR